MWYYYYIKTISHCQYGMQKILKNFSFIIYIKPLALLRKGKVYYPRVIFAV